jgi:hypothetical protein
VARWRVHARQVGRQIDVIGAADREEGRLGATDLLEVEEMDRGKYVHRM